MPRVLVVQETPGSLQRDTLVEEVVHDRLGVFMPAHEQSPTVDALVDGCPVQVVTRGWTCQQVQRGSPQLHGEYAQHV